MKEFVLHKCGIYLQLCTDAEDRLLIKHIGITKEDGSENRYFTPTEVFISGENPNDHHGAKHTGGSLNRFAYESYDENEHELVFYMRDDNVRIAQHYEFYDGIRAIRAYATVENISDHKVGMEYISSFCMYGFDIKRLWLCHNAWCRELQWYGYSPEELGYNHINAFSTKRISVSNTGTWSTKEYMPMGIIDTGSESVFWQIEHNGSWNFEISDISDRNYLKLSGPSERENGWWKALKPGEIFETVKTAICFADDMDGALREMTRYRRKIAYRSMQDIDLPIVFNDYMKCLSANPTTKRELPVIDAAARLGAEIFCMDAGWYADGTWWETVGAWEVCEKRFPNGMREVFDAIRQRGMQPGIWLEPEVIGIHCPILERFTDDCFLMRHGKRVIDHGRYHLDFRSKKVTEFLDGVVDGLIRDYKIAYFKFDYNIDGGIGTEVNSDSFGDGLLQCQDAYLRWIDGIYQRHPGLIIENCASGGMRMDYRSLSHCSVQSVSDAEDYKPIAAISAMAGTAVILEQAQIWVVPMRTHTVDEITFNMVNAIFCRPSLSGEAHLLSDAQFAALKDGVEFYRSIRSEIPGLIPFYPCGAAHFGDNWMVSGFYGDGHDYIVVKRFGGSARMEIPVLDGRYQTAECVYPKRENAAVLRGECLDVTLPENAAAVIRLTK